MPIASACLCIPSPRGKAGGGVGGVRTLAPDEALLAEVRQGARHRAAGRQDPRTGPAVKEGGAVGKACMGRRDVGWGEGVGNSGRWRCPGRCGLPDPPSPLISLLARSETSNGEEKKVGGNPGEAS